MKNYGLHGHQSPAIAQFASMQLHWQTTFFTFEEGGRGTTNKIGYDACFELNSARLNHGSLAGAAASKKEEKK
jgi:hypothetical protein